MIWPRSKRNILSPENERAAESLQRIPMEQSKTEVSKRAVEITQQLLKDSVVKEDFAPELWTIREEYLASVKAPGCTSCAIGKQMQAAHLKVRAFLEQTPPPLLPEHGTGN